MGDTANDIKAWDLPRLDTGIGTSVSPRVRAGSFMDRYGYATEVCMGWREVE